MRAREVCVTGYGLVAPTVLDGDSLFRRICENRSCVRSHPLFEELGFPNTAAGYLDDEQWLHMFDAYDGDPVVPPRQCVLATYVARQALGHAGLTANAFGRAAAAFSSAPTSTAPTSRISTALACA